MIQVDDLRKEYDGLVAVDDVSFEARPGQIFGLLGPNGAGKSTTIGCISGLLTPTSGAVRVQGYDVARDPVAAKSGMGIVPQEVALYEDLPAEENLRFWAEAYGLRGNRAVERVRAVLETRAEPLGITPGGVIESWVPVFIFTILFGLSMDYHLFILTRIKEARDRGMESRAAVASGVSVTAGTITSAASIMVVVFAAFVTLKFVFIQQLGLGLAVAVFIDATIVRSVLLPASMQLLGDWNWWLPGFLGWLPHITIGGEGLELAEPEG